MTDWSWLDPEEDKILDTFKDIQFIRCYTHQGERFCSLYTEEGLNKINRQQIYSGEIDVIDISTQWGSNTHSDVEANMIYRTGEKPELGILSNFDIYTEGKLECKLVENRNTRDNILYCQDEE